MILSLDRWIYDSRKKHLFSILRPQMTNVSNITIESFYGSNIDSIDNLANTKTINELSPDVFSFQEIPDEDFCKPFSDKYQYSRLVPSHSGFSSTFVKHQYPIEEEIERTPFSGWKIGFEGQTITILGGHLFPFEPNYQLRFEQLQTITSSIKDNEILVIFGDMNMRENETKPVIEQLNLQDAFIAKGTPADQEFTWDTNINKFWEPSW